jgi:phage gp46-like protein
MPDVRLYQKDGDGGEVDCVGGQLAMDDGLDTAVYLSLFGGNDDDSGLDGDKPRQWWANLDEPDEARRYRSELQALLRGMPLIPANLRRAEDAAAADLVWMTDSGLASFVSATASMPAVNTVAIQLKIEIQDRVYEPVFTYRRNQQ